ncbi:hypothetical protein MVES1_002366 [Malassezia vespertilionis]|uniref:uncharacterized protein n=1 Tax=Malassezia vespertilionis TaxID=2020962 RepID=UPI0024B0AA28|nr:uncharacterized protein MVES1_002366 [Malassezia vespertilionis]WFD07010.1 hypothetical protein MVES1_002366 [Malassezia vespertilionis]
MGESANVGASSLYAGIFAHGREENGGEDTLPAERATAPLENTASAEPCPALPFAPRKKQPRRAPTQRAVHAPPDAKASEVSACTALDVHMHSTRSTARQASLVPSMHLGEEDVRRDKALAVRAAQERGKALAEDHGVEKVSCIHAASRATIDADYDPAAPNEYAAFKALLMGRRQRRIALARGVLPYIEAEESDEDTNANRKRQFAPPSFYRGVLPHTDDAQNDENAGEKGTVPEDGAVRELLRPRVPPPGPPPTPPSMLQQKPPNVPCNPHPPTSLTTSRPTDPALVYSTPSFAERLMARYGYKHGEGLGADGNKGITAPLFAKSTRSAFRRGTIINTNTDSAQEDACMYGNLSEAVLLENIPDADDLCEVFSTYTALLTPAEKGNEHGYVRRVFLLPDTHNVRVVIRFTGMAGAYRAVRALDGRYYAGEYGVEAGM